MRRVYSARFLEHPMNDERRECELWRDGDWRCELWRLGRRHQVRLYLRSHLVSDLLDGPNLNLERQTAEWWTAVQAEIARTTADASRTSTDDGSARM